MAYNKPDHRIHISIPIAVNDCDVHVQYSKVSAVCADSPVLMSRQFSSLKRTWSRHLLGEISVESLNGWALFPTTQAWDRPAVRLPLQVLGGHQRRLVVLSRLLETVLMSFHHQCRQTAQVDFSFHPARGSVSLDKVAMAQGHLTHCVDATPLVPSRMQEMLTCLLW